jgi:hypothetical protein
MSILNVQILSDSRTGGPLEYRYRRYQLTFRYRGNPDPPIDNAWGSR